MNNLSLCDYKKFLQILINSNFDKFELGEYKPYENKFIYEKGEKLYNIRDSNYQHFLYWIYDTFVVSTFKIDQIFNDHLEVIEFLYQNLSFSKTIFLIRDSKFIKQKITRTNLSANEKWKKLYNIIYIYNNC